MPLFLHLNLSQICLVFYAIILCVPHSWCENQNLTKRTRNQPFSSLHFTSLHFSSAFNGIHIASHIERDSLPISPGQLCWRPIRIGSLSKWRFGVTAGRTWAVSWDKVRASMPYSHPPYSRPDINTYEKLIPNVPPSDQMRSIIPTTDQLNLPQINCSDHWSAQPRSQCLSSPHPKGSEVPCLTTDQQSLALISSPYHWSSVPRTDHQSLKCISSP